MIQPGKNPAKALVVLAEVENGRMLMEADVWARAHAKWPDEVSDRANFNEALNTLRLHKYVLREGRRPATYYWKITDAGRQAAHKLEQTA